MAIHWRISSIPELQSLPPEERKQVWREAYKRFGNSAVGVLWLFLFIAISYLVASILEITVANRFWRGFLGACIGAYCSWPLLTHFVRLRVLEVLEKRNIAGRNRDS
jgi:hypothetical protein